MNTFRCPYCSGPVACFGAYDGDDPGYACNSCCGHGNEDGWCEPAHERGVPCHCRDCVEDGLAPEPS